jgi:hypothetical protein
MGSPAVAADNPSRPSVDPRRSVSVVPRRLDFVRFRLGDDQSATVNATSSATISPPG